MKFDDFFCRATGNLPYRYQARLARDGLPAVIEVATGAGKTAAAVLAWLWRRLHGPDPEATPRRLIFALPQRTLVEQTSGDVREWLKELGLSEEVALHVVMGGMRASRGMERERAWRLEMDRPAIVVGTIDSLVSKALNRGYGISRATYPVDFALVANGAHWVIDEVQLAPESTTTLRQLAAFVRRYGSAEPFGLTCMSATVSRDLLRTVDNPHLSEDDIARIEDEDRVGELAVRLNAARTIRRLPVKPGEYKDVAAAVRERHRPGSLTLVVVNTVEAARKVRQALTNVAAPVTLLHSRFRAVERAKLIDEVTKGELGDAGRIVVSTQVVEAGVDLNATTMVIEAAPWPSVVQRAGRCNRTGRVDDAELWWLPPSKPAPYEEADIDASVQALTRLEGVTLTGEQLTAEPVPTTEPAVAVLRRTDLLALFDTAPDLSGADLDVAPYVRDAEDLDVQLAWAEWTPGPNGAPPADAKPPEAQWRCRVPLGELRKLGERGSVWRFDQAAGGWTAVTPARPARPGELLVMAARDGGYDTTLGLDPSVKRPVPNCPSLETRPDPAAGAEEAFNGDDASRAQREWQSLSEHSEQVRDEARRLLESLRPTLPPGTAEAVVVAGYAHDAGKVHPTWQDALCSLASEEEREFVAAGRPWAKSRSDKRLSLPDGFRHELVSLLLLDGPLRGLLAGVDDPDLVRYLVLAHHGKLRVQVRGPEDTEEKTLLGLRAGDVISVDEELLGQPPGEVTVDLEQFTYGGERSWTRTALALRDKYGVFTLAYLETLVRIADWRASAGLPTPGEEVR